MKQQHGGGNMHASMFPTNALQLTGLCARPHPQEHHPDKGGDTAFFQLLKEADTVLTDPHSRKAYDRKLGARKPRFLSDMRVTPAQLEAGAAEIPGYPGASLRFRPGEPTPFIAKIPGLVPQSNTCDGSGSVTVRLEAQLEVQIGGSAPVRAQVHRVDANSLLNLGRCGAGLAALAKLSEVRQGLAAVQDAAAATCHKQHAAAPGSPPSD